MIRIKNPLTLIKKGGSSQKKWQPSADMVWGKAVAESMLNFPTSHKVFQYISNLYVYSEFTVPTGGKVVTSDGAEYTSGDVKHFWDDTNAHQSQVYDFKLRWICTYYAQEVNSVTLLNDVMYACFDNVKFTNQCIYRKKQIEYFDLINGSNYVGTDFEDMFSSCYSLQTIPLLDTSSGTTFSSMFSSCHSLQTIPLLDTSSGTTFSSMFSSCYSLQTIPLLDTSLGTSFSYMFGSCYSLQTIPQLNTSLGTDFGFMFSTCRSLQTIPQLNTSSGTTFSSMFSNCSTLEFIEILNLSKSIGLNNSSKYSRDTLMNGVINNLVDLTGGASQTLTLGSKNLAKLSDEDKSVATNKNWVLA